MLKKNNLIFTLFYVVLIGSLSAQDPLTFEEALQITLEKNYNIRLARIDEQIAGNNAKIQNSGYLPTLNSTGAYTWTHYEGKNNLITGDQSYDPNSSYNYNAGISLNYTLFEGQGRRYNYLLLQEAKQLSELQARGIIENTILELSGVYFETARLQEAVSSLKESLSISDERLKRSQYAFEYGQSTKLDVLNARVDLNNDSINLLNARQQLENFKRSLNLLMGAEIDQSIALSETLEINKNILREDALAGALARNTRMESMTHSLLSSEYALNSTKAGWWPNLGASLGYNYRGSDDPNGAFVTGSSSFGPTAGLNLNWQIFDGRTKTRIDNAKLNFDIAVIEQEATEQSVTLDLLNAHGLYLNSLFVLQAQEDNLATARSNFERSTEAYKIGIITSVEFRQAQLNLVNAELLLSQSKYNAKNLELQVTALMGALLK